MSRYSARAMRVVAIVQARMASTRLPGKVLAEVAGKPLLRHEIERLGRCDTVTKGVVATPFGVENGPIWDLLREMGVKIFCGPEEDVLSRVLGVALAYGADLIVEVTGDCPLICPAIVDRVVERWRADEPDLCANTIEVRDAVSPDAPAWPRGTDVRVFPRSVLEEVDRLTQDPRDREHVSLYLWEHPERYRCVYYPPPAYLVDDVRLTVDEPADLELVRAIFESFVPRNDFDLDEILELLDERPELREVNRHVHQKEIR